MCSGSPSRLSSVNPGLKSGWRCHHPLLVPTGPEYPVETKERTQFSDADHEIWVQAPEIVMDLEVILGFQTNIAKVKMNFHTHIFYLFVTSVHRFYCIMLLNIIFAPCSPLPWTAVVFFLATLVKAIEFQRNHD